MTRDELAAALIAARIAETKAGARGAVDEVFAAMEMALREGSEVRISDFGSFKVKQRAARTARNPISGEPVAVPAKKAVTFKVSKALKDAVNASPKAAKSRGNVGTRK
jgi:DNA-binding protein HU-beta